MAALLSWIPDGRGGQLGWLLQRGRRAPGGMRVMIVIAGEIEIDPTQRDRAVAAAVRMMEETRKEDGCISYAFSADLVDPGRFRIFEEWESQDALDRHFAAPHMAAFQSAVAGLGVKRVTIRRYEVSAVGPVR